jgi:hypothetical protein
MHNSTRIRSIIIYQSECSWNQTQIYRSMENNRPSEGIQVKSGSVANPIRLELDSKKLFAILCKAKQVKKLLGRLTESEKRT